MPEILKVAMLWWAKEIGNHCSTEMLFCYIHQCFISADAYFPVTGTSKPSILLHVWDCKSWDTHTHISPTDHTTEVQWQAITWEAKQMKPRLMQVYISWVDTFLCLIKCRLQLKLSLFSEHCQHHSPGLSSVSWGLLWRHSLSLITALYTYASKVIV